LGTYEIENSDLEAWELKMLQIMMDSFEVQKNNLTTILDSQKLQNFATRGHS
jgi:hypothetical protein